MKKTLTVNLGGCVYNIDDDAYCLLDNYLCNLKLHFKKEESAEEIVDDIERRMSELFAEKLNDGREVITLAEVEEVIACMGKPEEMEGNESESDKSSVYETYAEPTVEIKKRLYRNPDDKILGGVVSGMAAYMGWDVTLLRLLLIVILVFGYGTLIPIYIVCWLIIPEARTAAQKLSMRGEAVTVESIGKTVTGDFTKPQGNEATGATVGTERTPLQKAGDLLVAAAGWIIKILLVIVALVCSPLLVVFGIVFVALLIAAIAVAIGGGASLIALFPYTDIVLPTSPMICFVMAISGILTVGIPLLGLVWTICYRCFNWAPMNSGLKWTLIILWFVSCACLGICWAAAYSAIEAGHPFAITL